MRAFCRRRHHVRHLGRRRLERPGRQRQSEHAAFAGRTVHLDLALHQLGELTTDRQPQPGSAEATCDRTISLFERLEYPLHLFGGHAGAGVDDGDLHGVLVPADTNGHRTVPGELDRVADQVEQHLAYAHRIDQDDARVLNHLHVERVAVAACQRLQTAQHVVDQRGDQHRLGRQLDMARLDAGDVENVVDQRQQVTTRTHHTLQRFDRQRVARLLLRLLEQQFAQADDAVQRRAQLVAHVCQECGLGDVRRLGLIAAQAQPLFHADARRDVHR